jgi:hypothetical protein
MIVIIGKISIEEWGEGDDPVLFVSDKPSEPLIERLGEIKNKPVTVRYWTAERETTPEQIKEGFLRELMGQGDATLVAQFSEITGYLWTDNELNIGGHNLRSELENCADKWIVLEIEVHQ